MEGHKVRYAVVGLGHIAQAAVLPAFEHAENSELTALISSDRDKLAELGRRYDVSNRFTYDEYDRFLASGVADAVYVALPNDQHREYAVRAAEAGVHVLCEKPLAASVEDCEAMIVAAARNDVRLMTAYRLHFDPANLRAIEHARSGSIGDPRVFSSAFTMQVEEGNIRVRRERGGGTLFDIGIYCINAARYLFGAEPTSVSARVAKSDDPRFSEVEEVSAVTLEFPHGRLASFICSFGADSISEYRLGGTEGSLRLSPAYSYVSETHLELSRGGEVRRESFAERDQFAPELVHFSECVRDGVEPEPDGYEGLADVRIIAAAYRSAESGAAVPLAPMDVATRPTPGQEIRRPPVDEPDLVKVSAPHRD